MKNAKAEIVFSKNETRRKDLPMILGAFKAGARAHTKAYVTAATAVESTKSAAKPTPKPNKLKSNE